jgi:hypothetical protein
MARQLKTFETSVGFFDLAVAAPSMKAALEAWGAQRNLFHEGVAKQSDDPDIIAAAMAMPGVVLRRPVGSTARFKEHAELPTDLADGGSSEKARRKPATRKKKNPKRTTNQAAERKAARAFEKEQKRRERERARQEAARQMERERRQHAVSRAQRALDAARRKHENNAAGTRAELETLEKTLQAEEARWEKERGRLEAALRKAQG